MNSLHFENKEMYTKTVEVRFENLHGRKNKNKRFEVSHLY